LPYCEQKKSSGPASMPGGKNKFPAEKPGISSRQVRESVLKTYKLVLKPVIEKFSKKSKSNKGNILL
jgi:hypothetical protein